MFCVFMLTASRAKVINPTQTIFALIMKYILINYKKNLRLENYYQGPKYKDAEEDHCISILNSWFNIKSKS